MKRRLLQAMAAGFATTELILLIIQFCMLQAGQSVVTPAFAARFANEGAAVLAQLGLVGLIGIAFAGGAQVFEIEKWSFLQQGIVHFLITAAVWLPVSWLCWMPIPAETLWCAVLGWLATYAVTWMIHYFLWKKKVRELNMRIHAYRRENESD